MKDLLNVHALLKANFHVTDQNQLFEAYVGGTLDSRGQKAVEDHLRLCGYCREQVEIVQDAIQDARSKTEDRRSGLEPIREIGSNLG